MYRPLLSGIIVLCLCAAISMGITNREDEMMYSLGMRKSTFNMRDMDNGRLTATNLDGWRGLVVQARKLVLRASQRKMAQLYEINMKQGKIQQRRRDEFPCDLRYARSVQPPKSVDRLRPGDIDVIAAVGDSLSAGNGIWSESVYEMAAEFRAFSFSGGGYGNWRSYLTLPNILKTFNPALYGYSVQNSLVVEGESSRLNLAEPMIMSRDLPFQVQAIINRMRRDPNVDMQFHWKLLTIFVGSNDVCSDMCHYDNINDFYNNHERDLRLALTLLREQVPRLLVNLLPVPNIVTTLHPMPKTMVCESVQLVGCHCVFNRRIVGKELQRVSQQIERFQAVEKYVASLPEFNTLDFAVVYQPITENVSLPMLSEGDMRYFSSDCFHFSQLGHAAMANALFNSMLLPIGYKQRTFEAPFDHFECPTDERPFIATLRNSFVDVTTPQDFVAIENEVRADAEIALPA